MDGTGSRLFVVFVIFVCLSFSIPHGSCSPTFDDKSWSSVYNHDAYMSNRAVSADIMEPSHASSYVAAKSVTRLLHTVVEMSEVYANTAQPRMQSMSPLLDPHSSSGISHASPFHSSHSFFRRADTQAGLQCPTCRGNLAAP